MEETFASTTIDTTKWSVSNRSFEVGTGTFTAAAAGGVLSISGSTDSDYWAGASLKTAKSYVATKDLSLSFEVDRVSIDQAGTAGRTGVFITSGDRSRYVFFAQNVGENNWQVNVNPGNPTGGGTALTAFVDVTDTARHRMKLVANGQTVEVFLDGKSGGSFPFEANSGIFFEVGAYARATGDTVVGVFDNVKIEHVLPCVAVAPAAGVTMTMADSGKQGSVTVSSLQHDVAAATITVTSRNPGVAVPTGAVNGVLTLNFAPGAADTQTFGITPVGKGSATFEVTGNPAVCATGSIKVDVVAVPQVLLTDDFSGTTIDLKKWTLDQTPFDTGTATPESAVTIQNGQAKFTVTVESALWPGLALLSAATYTAAATTPVTFEIDRTLLEFDLVTGTGAEQRAGVWVKETGGNFVLFSDYVAHDGRNYGWRYNRVIGQASDNPTDAGIDVAAFNGPKFDNQKNHRMKVVADGATVKLFLDDILGAEVAFPFARGLTFGFGAYADEAGNVVRGYFDNARILGGEGVAPAVPPTLTAARQGANVVISWTSSGTLQSADAITAPMSWKDVAPAPTGNSYTVPAGQSPVRYYRVRQ